MTTARPTSYVSGPPEAPSDSSDADLYRQLVQGINDVLFAVDLNEAITFVSAAVEPTLGYSPQELIGKQLATVIHAEDLGEVRRAMADVLDDRLYPSEFRVLTKSGEVRWVRTSSRPLRAGHAVVGLCGLLIDITERKRAERALLESESRLRAITDAAKNAILMMSPAGLVSFWNPAAERILGYTRSEAIGKNLHELISPQRYLADFRSAITEFRRSGQGPAIGKTLELAARRSDGAEIPVELSLSAVQERDGWHAVGIIRDISEAKGAEAALRASEETMRLVLENAHDAFLCVDATGVITNWNGKAERMFGWTVAEALGRRLELIIPPRFRTDASTRAQWGLALEPDEIASRQLETIALARDGQEFPVEVTFWSMSVRGKWQANVFLRDLTEVKAMDGELMQLELHLHQAQKLEAIGELAAGISHEINTPTQYVGDNIRFLANAFADMDRALSASERVLTAARANALTPELLIEVEDEVARADVPYLRSEVPSAIAQADEGVQRISAIVRAMKEFSHPGPLQRSPADLNKAVESTVTVCRNEWKYVADLTLDLDPALPAVPCQIGEVKQVILNLIVNAVHAIEEAGGSEGTKGRITLMTRRDGEHVVLQVSDTGAGIPDAVRGRVFDPFFTTKPVGKGSGQGLAIAHNVIAVKHGGSITFQSAAGRGTVFTVRLPLDPAPAIMTGDAHD